MEFVNIGTNKACVCGKGSEQGGREYVEGGGGQLELEEAALLALAIAVGTLASRSNILNTHLAHSSRVRFDTY